MSEPLPSPPTAGNAESSASDGLGAVPLPAAPSPSLSAVVVAIRALDAQIAMIEAGFEAQRLAWERSQTAQRAHLTCLRQARAELLPTAGTHPSLAGEGMNGRVDGAGARGRRVGSLNGPRGATEFEGKRGEPLRNNTARILDHMRKIGPMLNADLYASLRAAGIAPSSQNALSSLLRRLQEAGLVQSANARPRYNLWKATDPESPAPATV